jgi:hypothetical protein
VILQPERRTSIEYWNQDPLISSRSSAKIVPIPKNYPHSKKLPNPQNAKAIIIFKFEVRLHIEFSYTISVVAKE